MKTPRVAIQGIASSFHDVAARTFLGNDITVVECPSFKTAFDALAEGKADRCVAAIENSIAGSILSNYALLKNYHFRIIGEVYLRIDLNLMALPGVKTEDLRFIQSHPVAISQCAEFLSQYPQLKILESFDTAQCAKEIRNRKMADTATLASAHTAGYYGLNILEKNTETNKKNFTRFFILSREASEDEAVNKASVSFQVAHTPGSLAKVLNIFHERSVNLTRIQSVPVPEKPNEYSIHVDLEWDSIARYREAMANVLQNVSTLSILGEYKSGILPIN